MNLLEELRMTLLNFKFLLNFKTKQISYIFY